MAGRLPTDPTGPPERQPEQQHTNARQAVFPGAGPIPIGRGDLDPLAGGRGGGMIYDPMRADNSPSTCLRPGQQIGPGVPDRIPESIPPGARFDPYGPPELDESGNVLSSRGPRQSARNPNPDMARKPDFNSIPPKPGF